MNDPAGRCELTYIIKYINNLQYKHISNDLFVEFVHMAVGEEEQPTTSEVLLDAAGEYVYYL